jgi:hypothetical protein
MGFLRLLREHQHLQGIATAITNATAEMTVAKSD